MHFLTLWNHLNYYGLGINTDFQSAVLQQHYKRVAESWNGLSQITYLNFLLRTFNTRHRQGGDALNIRTASPSSSSSLVKTEGRVHEDSSEEIQNNISICLCSGYNVSLCSLIHVFVWNMSRLINQTIQAQSFYFAEKTESIVREDGRWKAEERKQSWRNEGKAWSQTKV